MTVSPYLGPGSLQPAVDTARAARRRPVRAGPHVQPRRRQLQHAVRWASGRWRRSSSTRCAAGTPRLGHRRPAAPHRRRARRGEPVRAVPGLLRRRRRGHPPGHGRRPRRAGRPDPRPGPRARRVARSADLRRLFGTGRAVVPTVSRDVLAAGPDLAALRAAAERWAELAPCVCLLSSASLPPAVSRPLHCFFPPAAPPPSLLRGWLLGRRSGRRRRAAPACRLPACRALRPRESFRNRRPPSDLRG